MATGSGKTLIMAGLMLYLYKQGYRNFLFFVNLSNIVEKTRENFRNPTSSKYLFADEIVLDGERIRINQVDNFQYADQDAINICFATTQGLHMDMWMAKENGMSFDDFDEQKVVLISDEAHHLNVDTRKKMSADEETSYKNICEIGKERIRRAGDQLKSALAKDGIALRKMVKQKNEQGTLMGFTYAEWEESPEVISAKQKMADELDTGFRVLKLGDSNMKDVYYAADEYDQGNLTDMVSNIKEDRTDLDLLFGCLLDWGLPLSLPYQSEQIDGCTVHTYNDGDLIACFDANVPESVVKEIAKRKPLRAVFRDSSFADSPSKINVFEIFKLYMPEDANDISKRVRVI